MNTEEQIHTYWEHNTIHVLKSWLQAGLTDTNLVKLVLNYSGTKLVKPLGQLLDKIPSELQPFKDQVENLIDTMKAFDGDKAPIWTLLRNFLEEYPSVPIVHPYLSDLRHSLGLDQAQEDLVKLLFLNQSQGSIDMFLENLEPRERIKALELACPQAGRPLTRYLRRTEVLRTNSIVEISYHKGIQFPEVWSYFALTDDVFFTLSGDTPGGFRRMYFKKQKAPGRSLESLRIPPCDLRALRVLLARESPTLFLFHGEPGTGKTELAKALGQLTDREPIFLSFDGISNAEKQFNRLITAVKFLNDKTQVLIIDEADSLLNTQYRMFSPDGLDKGLVNRFFDEFQGKAVFISNSIDGIETSLRRRFHFTKEFRAFAPQDRLRLWSELSRQDSLFDPGQLRVLASTYQANPAQVQHTLALARDLKNDGADSTELFEASKVYLETTQKLLWGTKPAKSVGEGPFDLAWVNLDLAPDQLIGRLKSWTEVPKAHREGLGILFHGLPGTGKTLLGRHLAQALELPLVLKRGSDLVSPYVGETETNIRRAFEEAEEGILMIDEADSFFLDRSKATHLWERTQTNEILACLEDFKGLFIATTNYQQLFDAASFRRFAFKVAFLPLRLDQRKPILAGYFPDLAWDSTPSLDHLNTLTPGDVKAVQKRLAWDQGVTPEQVVVELKKELALKTTPAGTVGFKV